MDVSSSSKSVPQKCEAWKEILGTSNSYFLNLRNFYDKQKCYFCFSNEHSYESCKLKLKGTHFFAPAIDEDLLPRFMKTLNARESYFLAFSSQKAFNLAPIKFIRVEYGKLGWNSQPLAPNCITAFYERLCFIHFYSANNSLCKILINNAKTVALKDVSISCQELLHILIPKITSFECTNVTLPASIKFVEILKKLPNIKNLKIHNSNVEIEKSWRAEFVKYVKKKKCERLEIDLKYCDFDVKKAENFLKNNCKKKSHLIINITEYEEIDPNLEELEKRILKNLSEWWPAIDDNNVPCLYINTNSQYHKCYIKRGYLERLFLFIAYRLIPD